jgi:Protein of unknown function (DUF3298)/Deacetylase PdaC
MSNLFKKTLPLLIVLLTIMSSCDKASKKGAPSVSNISEAQKGFYKHLKGTVGDYPVTMDLIKNVVATDRETAESWVSFSGYYYYDKYQEPIILYGSVDSTGAIVLGEWAAEGESAQFRGNLTPEGAFIGTWQDSAKTKTLNVILKEAYSDGAIALENKEFGDSFRLFEKLKNSPVASFGMDVLMASQNTEGGVSAFLKKEIFSNMHAENGGEETPKQPSVPQNYANASLTDVQKTQRDSFFAFYREAMKEEKPDSAQEYFAGNYTQSSEMQVVFNEKGLLSVGYSYYSFSGGAHGNHGTTLASYDLVAKKQLKLGDVFKPNYKKTLSAALERALRKKYKLNPKESLAQFLFEKKIGATENFAITRKGILFDYPPYDIAAYAMGEIQLYVSFEDIKAVLK